MHSLTDGEIIHSDVKGVRKSGVLFVFPYPSPFSGRSAIQKDLITFYSATQNRPFA